ncbi:RNA polymerase sigma-70 factor [Pedobacter sp. MC2016-05]|uniref:RNA polymerase sigma factor n=1 Tax=Pedobacter sp. MC2016-05 TaxID=2994474 RepID=UPI0022473ACB|nr:RNA polymerase sigma-70 factor [Pedobacter sp. MC2016-05]MCX2473469.1 RNA polymerase sigma-70 factor [Pedobacter sp. MC2016-05]
MNQFVIIFGIAEFMFSYSKLSDNDLLSLLNEGNELSFSEIYNRYWEKMYSYSIRLTKSQEESADIVQEIFISLWNRRLDLAVKGSLASYLIKSARNLSLRYIERNIHQTDFAEKISEFTADTSLNIEESISIKELEKQIELGISKLPKKMKEVYILSRDEQLSYREIAVKLEISEGTVKKQIHNSLKIIAESLNGKLSLAITALFLQLLK